MLLTGHIAQRASGCVQTGVYQPWNRNWPALCLLHGPNAIDADMGCCALGSSARGKAWTRRSQSSRQPSPHSQTVPSRICGSAVRWDGKASPLQAVLSVGDVRREFERAVALDPNNANSLTLEIPRFRLVLAFQRPAYSLGCEMPLP